MDRHHQARHAKKPSSKVYVDSTPIATASAEPPRPHTGVRDREAPHTVEHSASAASSTVTVVPLVGTSTAPAAAAALPPSQLLSTRLKQQQPSVRLVSRLSHDISTEQLIDDQLIDGKVADGEDDEDDDEANSDANTTGDAKRPSRDNNSKHPSAKGYTKDDGSDAGREDTFHDAPPPTTKGMYRIESHSALSSLEAKNMVDKQQHGQSSPTRSSREASSGQEEVKSATSESSVTVSRSSPSKPHKLSPLPAIASGNASGNRVSPKHSTAAPIVNEHPADACEKCTSNKEMPPMHCAAYSGHAECLEALLIEDAERTNKNNTIQQHQQQQTQKRQELDKKHRTPLFYACAANRLDCVALLLVHRASWRDLPDKQLDTPVHVCCFFGWHDCLAKLLDAGANPHGRNAKGFKPSHIAKTKDCLALLLSFGDDLLQGDKLGRTPLFVTSARDRALCVEFLCAWNHETRSWMLEQEDQRGDRPIHAAACNGSVAALEVLLKYGADPLMPNGKALTPKDLAAANGHLKCVEILSRAEEELAKATTWYAPANAMAGVDGESAESNQHDTTSDGGLGATGDADVMPSMGKGWIECWDYDSGQPFYYHNLSGKCQWEVPPGFTPQLQQRQEQQQQGRPPEVDNQQLQVSTHGQHEHQHQQQTASDGHGQANEDDDGSEYVWVKKKKQTVCVVTGKATEWTAVQDPASRAIYYKNTRTGQSQWEEPDAVQQLQSASGAHAAQEATRIWDELDGSRNALAAAIAREKHRQIAAHRQTLENYKCHLRARREEMQKREEQARLQQLLPRSSFVRRKKQSMMMKVSPASKNASSSNGKSVYVTASASDEKLEQICAKEPALDIFLSTYMKLQGVRNLQVMTTEKRFCNCLFHYYTALVDPLVANGLSKSQFRIFLRDAAIIPSGSSSGAASGVTAPLKLHIVDLIFAQAARAEAIEAASSIPSFPPSPTNASHSPLHHHQLAASQTITTGNHLMLAGFTTAMQIVRDHVVTQVESQQQQQQEEIEDDEEWFLSTFLLPLTLRLGAKLVSQIRECKELDLQVAGSIAIQELLATHRQLIQQIHRHYSSQEPKLKMLSFRCLSHFTLDFGLLLSGNLPALHQLYEAVNWISGNAHTEIISFEKFQQLLVMLACFQPTPSSSGGGSLTGNGGGGSTGGVVWRAVPSLSVQVKAPELTIDANNKIDLSSSGDREKEASHMLECLTKFFQQLERSPAKHRIKTELAMSASKILASSGNPMSFSPPKLTLTGQSTRSLLSHGGGLATAAAGAQPQTSGMFRVPSTPVMHFRS